MIQKYRPKIATKIFYCSIVEKNSGELLHVARAPCHGSNAAGGGGRRRQRLRGVEVELGMATDEGAVVAGEAEHGAATVEDAARQRRGVAEARRRRVAGARRRQRVAERGSGGAWPRCGGSVDSHTQQQHRNAGARWRRAVVHGRGASAARGGAW
jgi:hypothetical protein